MGAFLILVFLIPFCWNGSNEYLLKGNCTKNISKELAEKLLHIYPEKLDEVIKDCAVRCVKNRSCEQFSHISGSCQLYTQLEAKQPAFDDKCKTHKDCSYQHGHCLGGTCSCSIGYSYDFERNFCVKGCTSYGRRFTVYKKSSVAGCNKKSLTLPSIERCSKACRDETAFVCINAEFSYRKCNLCNKTWAEVGTGRDGTLRRWQLAYRHCLAIPSIKNKHDLMAGSCKWLYLNDHCSTIDVIVISCTYQ